MLVCDIYNKRSWAKVRVLSEQEMGWCSFVPTCMWLFGNTIRNVAVGLWLVGHTWHKGLKHYMENDNLKTAWINPLSTEWNVLVWICSLVTTTKKFTYSSSHRQPDSAPTLFVMVHPYRCFSELMHSIYLRT